MPVAPSTPVRAVALAAIVLTACSDTSGPSDLDPRFTTTDCTATITGGTVGNVSVRSGTVCTLEGVSVQGNVVATEVGGSLVIVGGRVEGNLTARQATSVEVLGTTVDGNIQIDGGATAIVRDAIVGGNIQIKTMTGPGAVLLSVAGNQILNGNIQVEENLAGSIELSGNTVRKGNMQVVKNAGSGSKVVIGNTVAQSLQCSENALPFVASANEAGNREGQCSEA